MSWKEWYTAKVSDATDEAMTATLSDGGARPCYLYYGIGVLTAKHGVGPEGTKLYGRLPGHLNREGLRVWINERARSLPIIPPDID